MLFLRVRTTKYIFTVNAGLRFTSKKEMFKYEFHFLKTILIQPGVQWLRACVHTQKIEVRGCKLEVKPGLLSNTLSKNKGKKDLGCSSGVECLPSKPKV